MTTNATSTTTTNNNNNDVSSSSSFESSMMPVWLNDYDLIDPEWIKCKMQWNDNNKSTLDDLQTVTRAQVVDISNESRRPTDTNKPKDGATLLLTLTFSSSSSKSAETTNSTTTTTKTKTFVIKQVPESGRALSSQLGLAREAFFYNHLAPKIKLTTTTTTTTKDDDKVSKPPPPPPSIPKIYYAAGDMKTGSKIVIMEDLSYGYIDSGILFGPGNPNNWNRDLVGTIKKRYQQPTVVPTSYEVANQTFKAIANVHATFWNDTSLIEDKSPSSSYLRGANWIRGDKQSWETSQGIIQSMWQKVNNTTTTTDGSDGAGMSIDQRIRWDPLVQQTVQKAMDGISWDVEQERFRTMNWTLVHGDFWPGNVMISTTTTTTTNSKNDNNNNVQQDLRLLDWEMTGVGSGPQDLGQYIISNMDPTERRPCEQQLIRNYYNELISKLLKSSQEDAAINFTWEECWREYTIGGLERWLWFLVYFLSNDGMLKWAQFFHDQISAFMHDHNIQPDDVTQPRP